MGIENHLQNATAFSERGHSTLALVPLTRSIGRTAREALVDFEMALSINPFHLDALYGKAAACSHLSRLKEASAAYGKAAEIRDLGLADSRPVTRHETGLLEGDIGTWNSVIEQNPEHTWARYCKGDALNNLGRHEEALKAFDGLIAIKPNYDSAWQGKAVALFHLGRAVEADKALATSHTLRESSQPGLFQRVKNLFAS